ncbi:MAG: hypothetical protein HC875_22075 [Anaerolineales bacterium]|nr:hypothetical protein [Anaerolineales bacterium]
MLIKRNDQFMDLRTDDLFPITTCPATGETVIEAEQRQLSLLDEPIVWWHCPVCNGWHVSLIEAKNHNLDLRSENLSF